jgi:GMP synthase PP-ATPase subunit
MRPAFSEHAGGRHRSGKKRKLIGNEFIRVLEEAHRMTRSISGAENALSGVIESVSIKGPSQTIKCIPQCRWTAGKNETQALNSRSYLRMRVRRVGAELGLRKTWSGSSLASPGLAVQIMGDYTRSRSHAPGSGRPTGFGDQEAGHREIWQSFGVLLRFKVSGSWVTSHVRIHARGSRRSYTDGMTADWVQLLRRDGVISNRM